MTNNSECAQARSFTLILPVWNEREVIVRVAEEILTTPGLSSAQILLVDDGSADGSDKLLDQLAARHPRCEAMHLPHGGKDRALWAAFEHVTTEWIGIMDADGQYDPRDFERIFHAMDATADAVWGVRAERHDHAWRTVISRAGRMCKRAMLGTCSVSDTGCGLWVARSRLLTGLGGLCPEPAGQVHCHLPEVIRARGGRVTECPITHRSRLGGKAKYGAWNRLIPGIRSLRQARWIIRQPTFTNGPTIL